MTEFKDLGLSEGALSAVAHLGYEEPTPVQAQAIPHILKGEDIIAAASTGTGKTAAFLLPTLSGLPRAKRGRRAPRILVVTPTRELAEQIAFVSYKIARACGHYTTVVFGGKPYGPQIRELRGGTDILIATPGRLNDLIDRGVVNLSQIEVLILDEADRMLDMGFLPDVKKIVSLIPEQRQTLLFSATIDSSIKDNLADLLTDPTTIQIAGRGETAKIVDQYIMPVTQKEKSELLKCLLDEKGQDRVIVFARTKSRVEDVAAMLRSADYAVESIHSDKTQGQRKHALNAFRKGHVGIIIATEVLARGIDIPSVDYVINYDLPDMAEDYIHRIGRTGRAGHAGFSVSFVSSNSLKALDAIERLIGRELPVMEIESYDVDPSLLRRAKQSGRFGRRAPSKAKGASAARYDFTGYGDLRYGKKRSGSKKRTDRASCAVQGEDLRPGRRHRKEMREGWSRAGSKNRKGTSTDTASRRGKGSKGKSRNAQGKDKRPQKSRETSREKKARGSAQGLRR